MSLNALFSAYFALSPHQGTPKSKIAFSDLEMECLEFTKGQI